jgi:glyoxylase-like metal-dependent hydrolase (beta-lactamase superfamily II)
MSDGDGGSQSPAATGRTAHLVRRRQRHVSPGVVEPYDPPMTTVHLLHPGYIRSEGSRVGSSISLVRDGDALIVADPGLVAHRRLILDPLAALEVRAEDVTHVFITHHHPDHTMNIALFPNAEVVDFWARYTGDQWLDHDGDGYKLSPKVEMWLTPGHTEEDASLIVDADDGVYALTHAWWREDRTPEIDPYSFDQSVLDQSRSRLLSRADVVIPGHGERFRVGR